MISAQRAMMDVYRYWLVDRRSDGFRLDVYWGPQNRYGEKTWWRPFREEIKGYKPEAFILGETDGTGVFTGGETAGTGVFAGLPNPMAVGRYHSLCAEPATLPDVLELTAQSQQIAEYTFQGFEAYTAATVIYVCIALMATVIMQLLERYTRIPGYMGSR